MTIAEAVYLLCAVTSLIAATLLLRYYRERRTKLLLWSVFAFVGLALNNVLLYVDLVMFVSVDLSLYRTAVGALAMLALVYGHVWETSNESRLAYFSSGHQQHGGVD